MIETKAMQLRGCMAFMFFSWQGFDRSFDLAVEAAHLDYGVSCSVIVPLESVPPSLCMMARRLYLALGVCFFTCRL